MSTQALIAKPRSFPRSYAISNRFIELDGLRGLAAIWVVVYHYVGGPFFLFGFQTNGQRINLQGLFAVHLFFIISGFVIYMTINNSRSVFDFAVSRLARLYPVSCLSTILMVVIVTSLGALGCHCSFTVAQVTANLTMLNIYLGFPYVINQGWSLAHEISFYFWIGVLFATGRLDRIERYGVAWVVISFVIMRVMPALTGLHIPWRLGASLDLEYSGLFFAGVVFYKIWSEGLTPSRGVIIVLCYLEFVIAYSWVWWAIMALIFAVFWLCVAGHGGFLRSKPLIFLGTISYSLYMTHVIAAEVSQRFLGAAGLPSGIGLAVSVGFAVAVAALVTFMFERPLNRVIRTAYRHARSAPMRGAV